MKNIIKDLYDDFKEIRNVTFNCISIYWFVIAVLVVLYIDITRPKLTIGCLLLAVYFKLWAK